MQSRRAAEINTDVLTQHIQCNREDGADESPYNSRPTRGGMGPPPIPIDPAIHSWNSSNISLSSSLGLDGILQSSPHLPEKLAFTGADNLDTLTQDVQLPAMRPQNPMDPNPMIRYFSEAGPWNPERLTGDLNPSLMRYNEARGMSQMHWQLRSPRSEIGSSTTGGRYPPDSGYRSMTTKSVRSADQADQSQSIAGEMSHFQFYPEESYQEPPSNNRSSPNPPQPNFEIPSDAAAQLPPVALELTCPYDGCGTTSRNQSEHKYVYSFAIVI